MPNPSPTAASVPATATIAVRRVSVLTLHPNGLARSSHRSLGPSGQISGVLMGAKIGRRERLGTQVEDLGGVSGNGWMGLWRCIGWGWGIYDLGCSTGNVHSNTNYTAHSPPNTDGRTASASRCGRTVSRRLMGVVRCCSNSSRICRERCSSYTGRSYAPWGCGLTGVL